MAKTTLKENAMPSIWDRHIRRLLRSWLSVNRK